MAQISRVLRSVEDGGLLFKCPGCANNHMIKTGAGSGPRWGWNGDVEKPTFTPSVLVTYNGADAGQDRGDGALAPPAVCHSFVTDGRIQFLTDCTHALAGQTVDLPPFGPREGAEQ
jgi:hypothetical protein